MLDSDDDVNDVSSDTGTSDDWEAGAKCQVPGEGVSENQMKFGWERRWRRVSSASQPNWRNNINATMVKDTNITAQLEQTSFAASLALCAELALAAWPMTVSVGPSRRVSDEVDDGVQWAEGWFWERRTMQMISRIPKMKVQTISNHTGVAFDRKRSVKVRRERKMTNATFISRSGVAMLVS